MTPASFTAWLAEMKSSGHAKTDRDIAALLGVSANSVVNMKRNGADKRTALACTALLHGLPAYE
ncbi:hypothetical protein FIU93_22815 [Labrenzia sp. THAF35]|uniref:hypothetical protein n=1 Tax=Labrenzia sp. THAF35 TaxID=2587854 RepID=UPI0012684DDD|nr:hypothetical protein [Labrenzia sp. THAF35]QFT69634.1 hypothetical protein FIU93_22815 [Labrenzia sp. THAF35]